MERRSFIQQAGIAGVLAAGVAPAVRAEPNIRWRLASSFPKSLDTIYGACRSLKVRSEPAREGFRKIPRADRRAVCQQRHRL